MNGKIVSIGGTSVNLNELRLEDRTAIRYYIFKGLQKDILDAIQNKSVESIPSLEDKVTWYSKHVVINANELIQHLDKLKLIREYL